MSENRPELEEWRRLYDAASKVKEVAPWEWMAEDIVFGVRNPETAEPGFVSVMGALGEHYAIAVYLGPKGLYGLWAIEAEGGSGPPETILETPQLQASWEDRNTLRTQDREIIKELGLKFRGRNAWSMFRSYRPGYAPWFLEAGEARFLAHVLEQVPDVTLRFREDPALLLEPPDDETYLVRVPRRRGETLTWRDELVRVPPPEPAPIQITLDTQLLALLQARPPGRYVAETDLFLFSSYIQEGKERPVFPYVVMTTEAQSGFVLGTDLLTVETSLEELWGQVPTRVLGHFAKMDAPPREVRVRSPLLFQLLQPLAEELHFMLREAKRLPSLDEAKAFMLERFS
jgi:hypothetical protein